MARIIFTSRYIKGASASVINNYINYIATREGVDISVNIKFKDKPASEKQKDKINELMELAPDMKDLLEYEDYVQNPTMQNASELITETISRNMDLFASKENFVGYMAMRPRVEKISEHGLFSTTDEPIDLEKVKSDVANHTGNIYTQA